MMTANDLIDQISKLYPSFSAEVDEEGQLIFYTGLYEHHDGTLVFREGDESEVDE
jgi:hypothetical protein